MAVYRPSQNVCELNFDDKYVYYLPLHEDTADTIDKARLKLEKIAPNDKAGVDEAYNIALDIIDDILGEGASDEIMTIFEKPGTLEVWDVLFYILDEFKTAYGETVERLSDPVTFY